MLSIPCAGWMVCGAEISGLSRPVSTLKLAAAIGFFYTDWAIVVGRTRWRISTIPNLPLFLWHHRACDSGSRAGRLEFI
jgi:hypothetical protein